MRGCSATQRNISTPRISTSYEYKINVLNKDFIENNFTAVVSDTKFSVFFPKITETKAHVDGDDDLSSISLLRGEHMAGKCVATLLYIEESLLRYVKIQRTLILLDTIFKKDHLPQSDESR